MDDETFVKMIISTILVKATQMGWHINQISQYTYELTREIPDVDKIKINFKNFMDKLMSFPFGEYFTS